MSGDRWGDGPIIVLGAHGMLGCDLVPALRERLVDPQGKRVLAWGRKELDISEESAVRQRIAECRPALVINLAAYTDVDGCERNIGQAMTVNGAAPGWIAAACRGVGAFMVHVSTDYVFDGTAHRPYREDDPAGPISVYGRSKWEGEEAVRAATDRHLLVRTSWSFGVGGKNFVEAILAKARGGGPLRVVSDQVGGPTLTRDLSEAVIRVLDAGATGTVHFANAGHCSRFEFATEIVKQAGLNVPVEPITTNHSDRPARRPAYSVLDLTRYVGITGCTPVLWTEALSAYLRLRNAANPPRAGQP